MIYHYNHHDVGRIVRWYYRRWTKLPKTFQVYINASLTRFGTLLISLREVSLTRRIIRSAARVHTRWKKETTHRNCNPLGLFGKQLLLRKRNGRSLMTLRSCGGVPPSFDRQTLTISATPLPLITHDHSVPCMWFDYL